MRLIGGMWSMTSTLQAGECKITLTKAKRELLHLLLAIAREQPQVLIGDDAARSAAARIMAMHVARIPATLPPRGPGTY